MIIRTIKNLVLILASVSFAAIAQAGHHGDAHKQKDIVEVASSAGVFNTLVAAVTAADLVATLQGEGPFTVFAPTDEAFAKLPEGTVETLLKPENKEKLIAILTYHVVPGAIFAADVKAGKVVTVNGSSLTVSVKDGSVFIDDAQVTKTDVKASNGVVHIIDSVVTP
ncbi:fasciclin domain-containing protein [Candidatus Pelagisphaera phototrophica]|uniref:fasciclin domain-containing protein n=1 Tax=Candidatus Pelagisphaera phototrophica TaxID=2684113 RepID=UPI0019D8DE49|nr:fasciclin domain-containing protein [Candidatus Pelagisphaera phototrophica]QXD31048.1 fasciclin domain-containing protein [Candidatus Pelagisphaera phototrophica]